MQAMCQDGEWYLLPDGSTLPAKRGGGRLMLKEVTADEAKNLKVHLDMIERPTK